MTSILIYRWAVFLLAAGYCLRTVIFSDFGPFGGPFRFLTIWALFLSFFCASRMLALTEGRAERRWDGIVAATAVLNAMVVGLYWRLYFADPLSVTSDGQLGAPHIELYLHALGPALQWIDALFVHRSFRKWRAAAAWLGAIVVAYLAWAELLVQRFNDTPVGSVTSGIPYPFLNNMPLPDRLGFYAGNLAISFVLLAVFAAIAWTIRRMLPAPAMPEGPPGSRDSASARPNRS